MFSLFKQHKILTRNIEESELRLRDIRRMKKEGLITNNDVLRSEMQLTNDRLSLEEAENSIALVSQQLNIVLGQDENLLLQPCFIKQLPCNLMMIISFRLMRTTR